MRPLKKLSRILSFFKRINSGTRKAPNKLIVNSGGITKVRQTIRTAEGMEAKIGSIMNVDVCIAVIDEYPNVFFIEVIGNLS